VTYEYFERALRRSELAGIYSAGQYIFYRSRNSLDNTGVSVDGPFASPLRDI
jgi:hypothetical protein